MFIERIKFIENELENIGATRFAQNLARKKGQILRFKISDLGVSAALILKQEAISVGADFIAPKHLILGEKGQYCGILLATAQQMERIIQKCEIQPFGLKKVGEILSEHLDSANQNNSSLRDSAKQNRGKPLIEKNIDSQGGLPRAINCARNDKFNRLPREQSSLAMTENNNFAVSSADSADSTDFLQGGLPRRFCESARNDNFLDSSVASLPQNDNFSVDSALSTQEANSSIADEFLGLCEASDDDRTLSPSRKRADALPKKSLRDAEFAKFPQIMGIINITNDSFYANSRTQNIDEILQKIEAMIAQGVEIIDVGAASTRPDSTQVPSEVEMERLKAPLQAIFDAGLSKRAIFSLDSYNFECTKFALEKGFHIINDVYGLRDVRLAELAKNSDRKIVLMHNSWLFPHEQDIVKSVDEFFAQKLEMLEKMGIKREQVILDVGFGFGKNSAENLRLTQNLAHFKHFGCAILMGASMKRTIGEVIGKDTDERLFGTLALHQIALDNGADIIRCHDFSAHIDMLKMWLALNERF